MIAQGETLGAGGYPHFFVEPFPFDYINPPLLLAPSLPDRGCVVGANDYSPLRGPGLGHFRKSCPRRTPDWALLEKVTRDAPQIGFNSKVGFKKESGFAPPAYGLCQSAGESKNIWGRGSMINDQLLMITPRAALPLGRMIIRCPGFRPGLSSGAPTGRPIPTCPDP